MKKKLISMICILALVFTSVVPASAMDTPAGGEIKPVSVSQLHINPLYEDVIDEAALRAELAEAAQYAVQPLDDITYYSDDEKIAEILRQAMVNRQESVTIGYASNANYTQEDHDAILDLVFVETDSPKEGDYLRFQYGGCGADGGGYIQNGVYYLTLVYSISYYTTAEQETAMDAAVESVLQNLGITWYMNDYDKVCKIYDYICSHVTYDNTNLNNQEYKLKYTAYAALINGTAVCQGYANLFYRLAKEADLSPRIISGVQTSSGGGHAWNIVKLGDWYYNLDATWDSAYVEAGLPYAYYLKGWTTFDDHTFDAAYTTEAFLSAYPMSTEAYVPGSGQETQKDISKAAASLSEDTFVYNGNPHTPEVMIEGLEYGVDYEVTYANNTDAGQAEAIARGIGDYCGEITLPFTIEPKDISSIKVSLDKEVYHYSGTPVQPLVDAGDLVDGEDFDLSYSNNNGIGTGRATLTGKGNYTGTLTVEFQILECAHQWDNGIVTLEPNCAREGVKNYTCTLCRSEKTESIPTNDSHDMGEWSIEKAATCIEAGLQIRTCQNGCGYKEEETLPATGVHSFGEWTETKAATCMETGLQIRTCQNGCGHREEEVLPATGNHTFGAWVETEPAACEKPGKAERTCADCGTEETKTLAALTHNPVEDAAVAPTCVKTGLTAGSHCSICGEILTAQKETAVDPNNHDMGQWKTEKPATCGETGLKVRTCQNGCGYREEEITPLAEHSFTKYVSNEDATCTEDGTKTAQCDNCTATRTVTDTDSAKGHTEEKDITKASRTADGMIVTTCSACGDTLKTEVIPAIGIIKLSYTKKVYTGSYISAPKLAVTDREGNAVTPSSISGLVNKKSVGRYKVTVSFKDDYYDDSVELFFTIVPKKVSSAAANLNSADATGGYNDIKFTWKKSTGATGYLVYYKKASAGTWSAAVSTTKTSYTKKNLAAGTKYTFKVVPYYKEIGKTTMYYDTAQYRTASTTTLKKVTGVKAAKSGTKVKVSWTNIAGESGYQISKMTKKSATQKTPTTVKSTTAKSKLLTATKGKTYYYKVRAYKVVDGKKIYGPWSEVKAFKRK